MSRRKKKKNTDSAHPDHKPLSPVVHWVAGLFLPLGLMAANMFRLRAHTVDDAYISYRYANNLARGLGLVFNEGERIEGYTNFLFTCLLALGIKLGIDPDLTAKVIGGLSGLGIVAVVFLLSKRMRPLGTVPVLSTWLLASSQAIVGYAVFGLETSLFVFLLVLATWLFLRERDLSEKDPPEGSTSWLHPFPYSGVALGLAGLTRPEAPMFAGLLMLVLAPRSVSSEGKTSILSSLKGLFDKRNLARAALFGVPVLLHLLFRKTYYGEWVPNTFLAKTGNLSQQVRGGLHYLTRYLGQYPTDRPARFAWGNDVTTLIAGAGLIALALGGAWLSISHKRRDLGVISAIFFAVPLYVLWVGGDWMPLFRFMAPFEPFCFLLADVFARRTIETKSRGIAFAVGVLAVLTAWVRGRTFTEGAERTEQERAFWSSAAGGVAAWFEKHGERGTLAVADMGYIAYKTDYPILDLMGLTDPVISRLPGGYGGKTGPGYAERVFQVNPKYFVFVGSATDCVRLPFPSQARLRNDRRFRGNYEIAGQIRHTLGGYWCIFQKTSPEAR